MLMARTFFIDPACIPYDARHRALLSMSLDLIGSIFPFAVSDTNRPATVS